MKTQNNNFNDTVKKHVSTALSLTAVTIALLLPFNSAQAEGWTGNTSGMIGKIKRDDSDWDNHKEQDAIALLADFKKISWPVSLAVDVIGSGDEDKSLNRKQESFTAAVHLGVRKVFEIEGSAFKPYIGGGVALINTEMNDINTATHVTKSEDDSATGTWVNVGTYVEIGEQMQLGFDVRYSDADVTVFDKDRQAGGLQTAVTLGYHW